MVVKELFSRSSEVICFPPKDKQVCMRYSMMDAPFPGALLAMDGTLCMLTTKGKHNEYVGRKSLPQMTVLVVCDWNMGFLYNHRYKCRDLLKRYHYHMIRHTVYYIWLVGTPGGNGSLT